MDDVAEFLRRHPPFDDLDDAELAELVQSAEVEYFADGATIFRQGEGPMQFVRVVVRGSVELVDRGSVLDVLREGDMFGHPSMLSGLPTGFEARAHEDVLCYRLPAAVAVPLLSRPEGLRFVARTLLGRPKPEGSAWLADVDPAQKPVRALLREEPVVIEPSATIRETARTMAAAGVGAVLVRLPDREFGIVTDRDLRVRVVANGTPSDGPVSDVMTAPVYSAAPESPGTEVMLEMLDRAIQHVPVITPAGEPLGVLTDVDLLAVETRTPFWLRRSIARAEDVKELRAAVRDLHPTVIALQEAEVRPAQISAIIAIVADAVTRRSIELAIEARCDPPCGFSWLALGSVGRREVVPGSDIDSAIVWDGDNDDEGQREYFGSLAGRVMRNLEAAGFHGDPHGATAADPLFERSADAWRDEIRHCLEHTDEDKALILVSLLYDARPVHGLGEVPDILDVFRDARRRRGLLNLLGRLAVVHKPPTGFLRFPGSPRDLVVEHSGEHRGHLDIKEGGMLPVSAIARYAGLSAGAVTNSTDERLRAAADAGKLTAEEARTLEEAYDLFWGLRLEHQVEQLRQGLEPDNFIDPKGLNPLTRRYLRDAFNAVRAVQRKLTNELTWG